MGSVSRIDDPGDPRLDDYRTLRDPQLRKRYENQLGVFVAEGPNVVAELLRSRYATRSVLVTPERQRQFGPDLARVDVLVAERALIEEVVRFPLHQGAIAVGERQPPRDLDDVLAGARLVAVLEEMNDPENMGSLFRSARALGVDAVLLGERCSDPLYRRCVRVSMGHVLHLPHTALDGAGLPALRERGYLVAALTTDGELTPDELAARGHDRIALVLGAEGPGLTADAVAAADVTVAIPMRAAVDSLNVSVAAAIAFAALS